MTELELVLERLAQLPVAEVLVAGPVSPQVAEVVERRPGLARLMETQPDPGIGARNDAAEAAAGEFLLMLDDDCYPMPGSIEALLRAFDGRPRLAVVGGLVREVDSRGRTISEREPGTFDWFLRAGARGEPPPEGFATFFFPEGAAMIRRDAYLETGGFFEPYFLTVSELDLSTRLIAAGWDVRYLPTAAFHHLKHEPAVAEGESGVHANAALENVRWTLRLRIRNQLWYFWLRFPQALAARRIAAYLAFDLVECVYRGAPAAWTGGILDAWRERDRVRAARHPLPREVLRRAELNRGRMHLRLLAAPPRQWLRSLRSRLAGP